MTAMVLAHVHDWIDTGGGTTACAVEGCRARRHEHRYAQDVRGRWRCPCGAWTPKPPRSPGQVADLSRYNVRQLEPHKPRELRAYKTVGWR
ncbi:MAG: hypothetical protein ACRDYA_12110 [Egibacteraceae bacterium]